MNYIKTIASRGALAAVVVLVVAACTGFSAKAHALGECEFGIEEYDFGSYYPGDALIHNEDSDSICFVTNSANCSLGKNIENSWKNGKCSLTSHNSNGIAAFIVLPAPFPFPNDDQESNVEKVESSVTSTITVGKVAWKFRESVWHTKMEFTGGPVVVAGYVAKYNREKLGDWNELIYNKGYPGWEQSIFRNSLKDEGDYSMFNVEHYNADYVPITLEKPKDDDAARTKVVLDVAAAATGPNAFAIDPGARLYFRYINFELKGGNAMYVKKGGVVSFIDTKLTAKALANNIFLVESADPFIYVDSGATPLKVEVMGHEDVNAPLSIVRVTSSLDAEKRKTLVKDVIGKVSFTSTNLPVAVSLLSVSGTPDTIDCTIKSVTGSVVSCEPASLIGNVIRIKTCVKDSESYCAVAAESLSDSNRIEFQTGFDDNGKPVSDTVFAETGERIVLKGFVCPDGTAPNTETGYCKIENGTFAPDSWSFTCKEGYKKTDTGCVFDCPLNSSAIGAECSATAGFEKSLDGKSYLKECKGDAVPVADEASADGRTCVCRDSSNELFHDTAKDEWKCLSPCMENSTRDATTGVCSCNAGFELERTRCVAVAAAGSSDDSQSRVEAPADSNADSGSDVAEDSGTQSEGNTTDANGNPICLGISCSRQADAAGSGSSDGGSGSDTATSDATSGEARADACSLAPGAPVNPSMLWMIFAAASGLVALRRKAN